MLILEKDGVETEIDARPSDAIALAMRFAAPLYVTDELMDQAGLVITTDAGDENNRLPPIQKRQKLKI